MAAPPGALQRAVFVAVPLALVVLIFITPAFVGRNQPQATDIPFLLVQTTRPAWNGTVNETALLYVRSALGVPLYDYLAINVSRIGGFPDFVPDCGGLASGGGANWSCTETAAPSLFFKIPAADRNAINVTAVAVLGDATFRYAATVVFAWGDPAWALRVQPEKTTGFQTFQEVFTASMGLEARP